MLESIHPSQYMWFIITFIIAYAIGSISFGQIMARIFQFSNPQEHGSGSTGVTNVLRIGGILPAILTIVGDSLKGVFAILMCRWLPSEQMGIGFAAIGVMLGHIFPFYLNFKGGKGVATFLAIETILFWKLGLILYIVWMAVAAIGRYASVASLSAAAVAPILAYFYWGDRVFAWLSLALFAIIVGTHQTNIVRLITRTEPKIKWTSR